jgi:diguanylate cyclase
VRELSDALEQMSMTLMDASHALEDANRDLEGKVAQRTEELHLLAERLAGQARTDALTGLPNRLAATERMSFEFDRLRRSGEIYCVAMLDIDFFKKVNDTYGHAVGDAVLQSVASVIARTIRATDCGARMGGEEFLVLLPMTDLAGATALAEKIRRNVEQQEITPVGRVTISAGVAAVHPDDPDADAALVRADQCLYAAKAGGRNRVMASG